MTKILRTKGSLSGKIIIGDQDIGFDAEKGNRNLVAEVSVKEPKVYGSGDIKIALIDCGVKNNIIRRLVQPGVQVTLLPWNYDLRKIEWDGLFISNGPGNPSMVTETIQNLRWALTQGKPIFGICMGNQLLGLAAGGSVYKMKFGNRGQNQSVRDTTTGRTYITPQNHGYAISNSDLPPKWRPYFVNTNDGSNEGLYHTQLPYASCQFHPEARGGPGDTDFLFANFLKQVADYKEGRTRNSKSKPSRVVLLGSGGLQIGQAGEFDYSGSQAIKALKEEGVSTVLINPNIATVQTKKGLAEKVYLMPVTTEIVDQIIQKESADGMLLGFGGQTGLNTGVDLYNANVLGRTDCRVVGTSVSSIKVAEDRQLFADALNEIGEKLAPSITAVTVEQALAAAKEIKYPVMIRSAFALGGLGSGIVRDEDEMIDMAGKALSNSPQILVEKSLKGWKEVEYEVVRDAQDNCLTVCNMENFDPMGIHTGESIVVAPSQTMTNDEYHMLRSTSIKVVRHLGIVGECNIQYALDPYSQDYCIIEVNPRLSRSSALASKATGYPLAYIAAKLSLGQRMVDVQNLITKVTTASFEPSLDYIVTKIPRWDLSKFSRVSTLIGSSMKSVGEVMAVDRCFEGSIQKAIRMVDTRYPGFEPLAGKFTTKEAVITELENPTHLRIFAIARAFDMGFTVDEIHHHTKITPWFLNKLETIHRTRHQLAKYKLETLPEPLIRDAKVWGFSDKQIANAVGSTELQVRARRKSLGITPFMKQIDTVAAEFPAQTNYLYTTYQGSESDVPKDSDGALVLGSGVYRIGSSVEFDYCGVTSLRTLRRLGYKTVMINYNPETVSTDYDESDRLYFEELSLERVLDVVDYESPQGTVVSCGGQQPQMLALPLQQSGVRLFGTDARQIDRAEDRHAFSSMLDNLGIAQPDWKELTSMDDAREFAKRAGYPVLIRPSYVLSGAAMKVVYNDEELQESLGVAADVSPDHPVVMSKFYVGYKEVEVDAVANNNHTLVNWAVSEHVENAGVHSGDAHLVLPAHTVTPQQRRRVLEIAQKISTELKIQGPMNTQYLVNGDDIRVIETNVRASRSFPFVSKVYDIDFIDTATQIFAGRDVPANPLCDEPISHYGVKAPQFSFKRLLGADPVLGVEMASTGEVACFGETVNEAFLKSVMAAGFKRPKEDNRTILLTGDFSQSFLQTQIPKLQKIGFAVYATPSVQKNLDKAGVKYQPLGFDAAVAKVKTGVIDLVWAIPKRVEHDAEYRVRRATVDYKSQLLTNEQLCHQLTESLVDFNSKELPVKSVDEYFGPTFNDPLQL